MKRVLVTGGTGFIGGFAVNALLEAGYEVHVATRGDGPLSTSAVGHAVDLLTPGAASGLVEAVEPTHLLHLAWYVEHGKFWSSPENLRWVQASLELAQAFERAGGERAVFAGTCAEYKAAHEICSERDTPLDPATLYGVSKDALRRLVEAAWREAPVSWAWGRLFLLYGPGESPRRLVPDVIRALLRDQPARCSDGTGIRDFLHVEDAGAAFAALVDSAATGPINVASGERRSIRDVVEAIAGIIGRPDLVRFGALATRENDPPVLVANVGRLRDEVSFTPRVALEDGLRRTVDWWRQQDQ